MGLAHAAGYHLGVRGADINDEDWVLLNSHEPSVYRTRIWK